MALRCQHKFWLSSYTFLEKNYTLFTLPICFVIWFLVLFCAFWPQLLALCLEPPLVLTRASACMPMVNPLVDFHFSTLMVLFSLLDTTCWLQLPINRNRQGLHRWSIKLNFILRHPGLLLVEPLSRRPPNVSTNPLSSQTVFRLFFYRMDCQSKHYYHHQHYWSLVRWTTVHPQLIIFFAPDGLYLENRVQWDHYWIYILRAVGDGRNWIWGYLFQFLRQGVDRGRRDLFSAVECHWWWQRDFDFAALG